MNTNDMSNSTQQKNNVTNRRKLIIGIAVIILCVVMGIRIWWVNYTAPYIPSVHHQMNEWVDLDGAFMAQAKENTQGYSIRIRDAELLSYNEFIEKYGIDTTDTKKEEQDRTDSRADSIFLEMYGTDESDTKDEEQDQVKSIVCLTMDIKNVGNTDGRFHLENAYLISTNDRSEYLSKDTRLLWLSVPGLQANRNPAMDLNIEPDTEFTVAMPYICKAIIPYIKQVTGDTFELIVSRVPIEHIIDISLD